MKKIFLLLIFSVFSVSISAQTDTFKLSLSGAMQCGLANRFDAKVNNLNIDISKNEFVKSKKSLLPDIFINGKVLYSGQVQPSIVSAGILGFTEPEKISLGMKNNTSLSLDFDYTIFKPGLYTDLEITSNNLELEKEKKNKSDIDIKVEIAEAYDIVVLKSLQYEIAKQNENRFKEYFKLAAGKYNNGTMLESDMLLSELDYKNATANTEKQKQNYLLSVQNLKYKINIPLQSVIILTDSLQSFTENNISADFNNQHVNRPEINMLSIQKSNFELQLKKAKQNYLPALSLIANYTQLFQGPGFEYNNSFYWAPVSYIGFKLSFPLTGYLKNTNTVEESKLKLSRSDMELKQKTIDVRYEMQEALTKLNNANQNLVTSKDNYTFSQKLYELKKQQYNTGSFSYENLLDTEKSLSNSEQEYILAVYNYFIAAIYYQKAAGRF
ncbi:MAG: TolC family protein [Ignavibacteria bacterium]|nr:TolC family protein [Ignavibacteria bacterium]